MAEFKITKDEHRRLLPLIVSSPDNRLTDVTTEAGEIYIDTGSDAWAVALVTAWRSEN